MKIGFEEFKDEIDTLVEFLTSDTWEFYGTPNQKPENIRASYENNVYTGEDCKTFWVILDQETKVEMIRIHDLQDGIPYDAIDYGITKEWENGKIAAEN